MLELAAVSAARPRVAPAVTRSAPETRSIPGHDVVEDQDGSLFPALLQAPQATVRLLRLRRRQPGDALSCSPGAGSLRRPNGTANEAARRHRTSAAFTVHASRRREVLRQEHERLARPTREHNGRLEGSGREQRVLDAEEPKVDPGVYQVTEASPTQTNWRRTTAASRSLPARDLEAGIAASSA